MKKVVTAQQVAQKAGVSPTTVSFVMNDVEGANISEATRKRVLQVAQEMGYVPHALAKSLARGRSDNIGLFLVQPHPHIFADPYIPNIISGIRQSLQAEGLRILVEQVRTKTDAKLLLTMLKSGEIAGAIITHNIWSAQQLKQLHAYPIVSLSPVDDDNLCYVAIDHLQGIRDLANHMMALDRKPIGVITYAALNSKSIHDRLATFRDTLAQQGYDLDDRHIREGAHEPQDGFDAMASLLTDHPDIQLVYCMNDMMAVGALAYLNQHHIRVPDDVAIVGYDDIRVSAFLNPPLTTVRAPEVALGESAGDLMLKLVRGESPDPVQHFLPTQFIIRRSCGYKTNH